MVARAPLLRRLVQASLLGALLAAARPAPAEPQQGDDPRAQALFLDGRAAMEKGDYTTACARFRESLTIVSRASTLLNLAQCEEHEGRLIGAERHWKAGIALLPAGDERLSISRERAAALAARIPRLTIKLRGEPPPGTRVEIDSAEAPPGARENLPADPGKHTVVVRVPGRAEQQSTVDLVERESKTVTLTIDAAAEAEKGAPEPAGGGGSGMRTAGYVTGGAGIAGLVIGGVLGALTLSKKSTVDAECGIGGDPGACTHTGKVAADAMKGLGVGSMAGLGVGVAGLGAGAILLLLAPARPSTNDHAVIHRATSGPAARHPALGPHAVLRPAAAIAPEGAMLGLGGSF